MPVVPSFPPLACGTRPPPLRTSRQAPTGALWPHRHRKAYRRSVAAGHPAAGAGATRAFAHRRRGVQGLAHAEAFIHGLGVREGLGRLPQQRQRRGLRGANASARRPGSGGVWPPQRDAEAPTGPGAVQKLRLGRLGPGGRPAGTAPFPSGLGSDGLRDRNACMMLITRFSDHSLRMQIALVFGALVVACRCCCR